MTLLNGLLTRAMGLIHAPGRLTILQFHRVLAAPDVLQPGELDARQFERMLDVVLEHCTPIGLHEGLKAAQSGKLPRRAVALTFDDGYADWVHSVGPALLARGIPATFFITTGQLDGRVIWHERIVEAVRALPDRGLQLPYGLAAFENLPTLRDRASLVLALQDRLKYAPLEEREHGIHMLERQAITPVHVGEGFSEEYVRWLHAKGFGIGAHTHNHPILNSVSDEAASQEIAQSREILEALVRTPVPYFAYPNGRPQRDFSDRHRAMVERSGYLGAVTTGGGVFDDATDRYLIPRFAPWSSRPWRLSAQLARNSRTHFTQAAERPASVPTPRRVMVVENGAGFGGAIVALETLLQQVDPGRREFEVITNLPVGSFSDIPAVQRHRVVADHVFDARALAKRCRNLPLAAPLQWPLLFVLGRADDLLNRLPYFARLLLLAIRLRPDLIHGNNELASNREALLVARLLRIPYVQHVRGPVGFSRHQSWLMRQPSAFIAVSRWLSHSLVQSGASIDRIRHIYDGVALPQPAAGAPVQQLASLREELGIPAHKQIIAMIGMLIPWKGQQLFLEAVERLVEEQADLGDRVSFLLIGGVPERADADYRNELTRAVERLRTRVDVRMTGHRSDLKAWLPELDVVVSASLDPEPLGLVMLEGLAFGCVFVGPAHGAAPEVVREGREGHLFEPRNADAMAVALTRALNTVKAEPRAERVASVSARLQLFDPRGCADQTNRVHDRLINRVRLHP